MGATVYSGVAIDGHQLVGYWGTVDCTSTLTHLLTAPIQPLTAQSVGISASGLAWDVWVRLVGANLVLGREPFGRTSLHWTVQDTTIWFASHLRYLLPLLEHREIDPSGLYGYSCFSYVPTPLSGVVKIQSLPAGEERQWSAPCCEPLIIYQHQWQQADHQIQEEGEAIHQLQSLLQVAALHQIQDLAAEPVGVLLSGGLDSAIVAALLVQNGVSVRAYTLDFGAYGVSEQPYAEQVASHLQIPLVKVPVLPRRVKKFLPQTVTALDQPYGDGVTVPLYLLCQAASSEVAVIFNGEGGDQLFGGWTNKPLIAAGIYGGQIDFTQQYLQTFHRLYGYFLQSFQAGAIEQFQSLDPTQWIYEALDLPGQSDLLHRLRRANLMLKGAQNIQPRATNLATSQGLQVRSIFCDQSLATWTFGVSGAQYLQGACEKYILKQAVAKLLPSEIVWRTKRGMGVPLTSWIFQELWAELGQWLNPQCLRQGGYWQPDIAERLVSGQFSGTVQGRRIGEILWLIIMWEQWRTQVFGEPMVDRTWDHPFWYPQAIWKMMQSLQR